MKGVIEVVQGYDNGEGHDSPRRKLCKGLEAHKDRDAGSLPWPLSGLSVGVEAKDTLFIFLTNIQAPVLCQSLMEAIAIYWHPKLDRGSNCMGWAIPKPEHK